MQLYMYYFCWHTKLKLVGSNNIQNEINSNEPRKCAKYLFNVTSTNYYIISFGETQNLIKIYTMYLRGGETDCYVIWRRNRNLAFRSPVHACHASICHPRKRQIQNKTLQKILFYQENFPKFLNRIFINYLCQTIATPIYFC